MKQRILTALVLAPLAICAILFLPTAAFMVLVAGLLLLGLWEWDEAAFLHRTEGSAIRRIGYARWRRNLAVALGNAWRATGDEALALALRQGLADASELLAEHIHWGLAQRAG